MERQPMLTAEDVQAFLDDVFPQQTGVIDVVEIHPMRARARMRIGQQHLRPGGTVSGPAMFAIADCTFYMAVLGMIGRQALTVTSNLNISFLRKPAAETDLICEARILKLGRLLATGDMTIWSDGQAEPVAHATCTYAIPQAR